MPVEIKELQIHVTVNQPGGNSAQANKVETSSGTLQEDERKSIINQCVEQVLEILNNKKER